MPVTTGSSPVRAGPGGGCRISPVVGTGAPPNFRTIRLVLGPPGRPLLQNRGLPLFRVTEDSILRRQRFLGRGHHRCGLEFGKTVAQGVGEHFVQPIHKKEV